MDKDYLFQKMNPGKALANVFGVSAALFFPLLFIHLKTFELLSGVAEGGNWALFANDCFLVSERNRDRSKDIKDTYSEHVGSGCSKALSCMGVCPMNIETITSMAKLNRGR